MTMRRLYNLHLIGAFNAPV